MDLRATVGRVLALLGVVCAVVGTFVLEGTQSSFRGSSWKAWATTSASRARIG
jgi:hypothetical protein